MTTPRPDEVLYSIVSHQRAGRRSAPFRQECRPTCRQGSQEAARRYSQRQRHDWFVWPKKEIKWDEEAMPATTADCSGIDTTVVMANPMTLHRSASVLKDHLLSELEAETAALREKQESILTAIDFYGEESTKSFIDIVVQCVLSSCPIFNQSI